MFFLLYKHTDDGVFDDFPKISDHFPKILQNCSKGQTNVPEHFPKISEDVRRFPKIAEDFRVEIIDIFTCEDLVSFLSICYYSLFHWLLYNKNNITR